MSSLSNRKFLIGLSLIEVMVAVAISSLILAAIYMLFSQGISTWQTCEKDVEVMQDARKAMYTMTKELANSADSVCTINTTLATDDTITFQIPNVSATGGITWGNQISYFRGGTHDRQRQLIKTETGLANTVLCNNLEDTDADGNSVTGVRFSKTTTLAGTQVDIVLQTRKATEKGNEVFVTLRNSVKLRN